MLKLFEINPGEQKGYTGCLLHSVLQRIKCNYGCEDEKEKKVNYVVSGEAENGARCAVLVKLLSRVSDLR